MSRKKEEASSVFVFPLSSLKLLQLCTNSFLSNKDHWRNEITWKSLINNSWRVFLYPRERKNREEIIEVENYRKLRRIRRNKSCDCFAAVKQLTIYRRRLRADK